MVESDGGGLLNLAIIESGVCLELAEGVVDQIPVTDREVMSSESSANIGPASSVFSL